MSLALEMYSQVDREAIEVKNTALLWIYLIEWFVVTGTAMGSGVLLWSLMIRRRFYRQVSVTKQA